jgi:hypothetical protein
LFSYALAAPTGEGALAAFLRNGGCYSNEAGVSPNEAELLWSCDGRGLFRDELVITSAEEIRAPAGGKLIHPGSTRALEMRVPHQFSISENLELSTPTYLPIYLLFSSSINSIFEYLALQLFNLAKNSFCVKLSVISKAKYIEVKQPIHVREPVKRDRERGRGIRRGTEACQLINQSQTTKEACGE